MSESARLVITVDSRQVGQADSALNALGQTASATGAILKTALTFAGVAGVSEIIQQADAYGQMSDRLRMASSSAGEYLGVQERLLASANRTYRPLAEAQELYIRTADSLRSMGSSTRDALDITDSFSNLLVTNAASSDRASSAISAYSKAIQTGKVESDGWQSIMAAMPTVVDSLAESTGNTTAEIRKLGIEGALSVTGLNEAFRSTVGATGDLADSMKTSVGDSFVNLGNATSTFIGRLVETTNATGILASGVGVLSENIGSAASVLGGVAVTAAALYTKGLASSAVAAYGAMIATRNATLATRAQAAAGLQTAIANQRAAQTATFRAAQEAVAARGTAVQTEMSLQLAAARAAEAAATTRVAAAQTAVRASSAGALAVIGGPVGLAVMAGIAATSFLLFANNTDIAAEGLEELKMPLDDVIAKFKVLNKDQREAALVKWGDAQALAAEKVSDAFDGLTLSIRATMVDPSQMRTGNGQYGAQLAQYEALTKKLAEAKKNGESLTPILEGLRNNSGISDTNINSWKTQAGAVSDANAVLVTATGRLDAVTAATNDNTDATNANNLARAGFTDVGEKYLGTLQKQLGKLQDNGDAVKESSRYIAEHTDLSETDRTAILSAASAIKAQEDANKSALKYTRDSGSETKKHATEVENLAEKLKEFLAESAISTRSANDMASAYLSGADNVRNLAIEQKAQQEALKTGAASYDEVKAALTGLKAAEDSRDIAQSIASMRVETTQTLAQATATLQGKDALETFNIQKSMSIALSGKKIDIGSKEYEQLLEQTKAQLAANKALEQASKVEGIIDRLNPQIKLLKDYTAERDALNAAMIRDSENVGLYQDALAKLGQEYEVNQSKATIWGQLTEGAIDRIDGVFADAWANIGSGANSLWDNLVKGAKQAFGEIAHMLTTKPLLASISNWLTGTDNGQGIGSVWSKLLGGASGSSSSSGGGLFGSGNTLVSMGKSIYQAYSAITGVGSSIASGYASGGIGGAISGGVGYYGNLLSSFGSTLSSGFSGIVGAITGSTATQVAANAATSAALQGAVAQGAAQVGTSIGIGGAAAAGAGTAAAAGAGAGFYASLAAMASNPVGWVIAAVTSAYQSGKLYDQGVRWNTKDVMNTDLVKYSGGIGQATLAPLAVTNNVLEKIVGGKMAAIFSGSTFASAIITKVSEKIFGGSWQTKDGGISLGVENGELDAQQYIDQKKKGGLFSSSKKRTRYSVLDAQTAESMAAVYDATEQGVIALVSRIGISVNEGMFDGLNIAKRKLSTQGKTGEEIQKLVSDWFSSASDQMVGFLDGGTGGFGYSFAELAQRIASFETFNDTLDTLNIVVLGLSPHSMELANSLIAAAGGMEAFQTATNTYYDNFFSESEKADDVLSAVTKQFAAMGVTLPGTRDAYRGMVEALDMTTASGQSMFMTLTGLAGNAAQAYSILEQRADAAAAAEAEAAAVATAAAKELADALKEALMGSVSSAMSAVQRAISAQQQKATEAYNATNISLNDMVSTVTENVNGLNSVSSSLSAALKALRGDSDDAEKMLRAQAQATLQSALVKARSGGSLSGFTGLEDALDTVGTNTTDLYSSLEDFNRDQGRTANVVAELNGINGKQLTTAEKSLKGLETQIDLAKAAYDAQMTAFDNQLSYAQAQMDALNGVDTSVLSVVSAVQQMNSAVVAALSGQASGAAMQNTYDNNVKLLRSVYQAVLGRDLDGNGLATWTAALANGSVTYADLAKTIATGGRINGETIMPGYATGGLISGPGTGTSDSIYARLSNGEYVMSADAVRMFGTGLLDQMNAGLLPAFANGGAIGETGPQLQVTSPSRIYNANQAGSMSGGNSNAGLVVEIRALGARLDMIQAETKAGALNGGKIVKLLDRVTDGGNAMLTKELA